MSLSPLYSILPVTILATVAAPGASAGDVSVPVAALTGGIPSGTMLRFAPGDVAVLASAADEGDEAIDVEPLAFDLIADDEAGYAPPTGNALLVEDWSKKSAAEQLAQHLRAEMALGLTAPVYTDTDAQELAFAICLQINFQLKKGTTAALTKSVSQSGQTGKTEAFRDRWVDPEAVAIVARVTGEQPVRFELTGYGT